MWCPVCNERTQQAPPSVSVRALIFALGRFDIVAAAQAKSLEKRWAKHRKEKNLDRNGKLIQGVSQDSGPEGPAVNSHRLKSRTSVDVAPEHEVQRSLPLSTRPTPDASER